MSMAYEYGFADGYEAGRDDPSDDILAEIAALRERIDALEWLREVEEVLESRLVWHPYFTTDADLPDFEIFKTALDEAMRILAAARASVES